MFPRNANYAMQPGIDHVPHASSDAARTRPEEGAVKVSFRELIQIQVERDRLESVIFLQRMHRAHKGAKLVTQRPPTTAPSARVPRALHLRRTFHQVIAPSAAAIADLNYQLQHLTAQQARTWQKKSAASPCPPAVAPSDYHFLDHSLMWVHDLLPGRTGDSNAIPGAEQASKEEPAQTEGPMRPSFRVARRTGRMHRPALHRPASPTRPRATLMLPMVLFAKPAMLDPAREEGMLRAPEVRSTKKAKGQTSPAHLQPSMEGGRGLRILDLQQRDKLPSCLVVLRPRSDGSGGKLHHRVPGQAEQTRPSPAAQADAAHVLGVRMRERVDIPTTLLNRFLQPKDEGESQPAVLRSIQDLDDLPWATHREPVAFLPAGAAVLQHPYYALCDPYLPQDPLPDLHDLSSTDMLFPGAHELPLLPPRPRRAPVVIVYPDPSEKMRSTRRPPPAHATAPRPPREVKDPPAQNPYAHLPIQFPALHPEHVLQVNRMLSLRRNILTIQAYVSGCEMLLLRAFGWFT